MKKFFPSIDSKLTPIFKTKRNILLLVLLAVIFTITSVLIYQTVRTNNAAKTARRNQERLEAASDSTTPYKDSNIAAESTDKTTISDENTWLTKSQTSSDNAASNAGQETSSAKTSAESQTTVSSEQEAPAPNTVSGQDSTLIPNTAPGENSTLISNTAPAHNETSANNQTTTAANSTLNPSAPTTSASHPSTPTTPMSGSAKEILSRMSLEEKVGQMFIARCPEQNAAKSAAAYYLGGYILFARDFEGKTKEQVIKDIESYQTASSIPMLIGVDEEGGAVNRISRYPQFRPQPFSSPQELYLTGGLELIQSDTIEKCQLLRELGLNLNFAPVCDVSENPNDFIYRRTLGRNASDTAEYVKTVVKTMKQQNIGSVLKHFPGYGNNADTHTGIAYDNRPYDTFLSSDFLPFQAGISAGADIVMVSHNIVNCMDSQAPASLSPRVHEILRGLGFSGVIITDELSMNGVLDYADDASIAIMAIQAGNDLLCCTNFDTQIPAVLNAVRQGIISETRIDESVLRILQMKISLGIIQS